MAEPRLIRTASLLADEIVVHSRLRPVGEAGVAAIIASAEAFGIRQAVDARDVPAGRGRARELRLIAGAHRLEAARRLNIELPVRIWSCTADEARLMEIDDQIAGSGLSPLDTAVFLAHRKTIYEKLYPQSVARTGAALAAARWNAADIMSVASFATVTAQQFGLTDRHVRRLVAVGSSLSPQDIDTLRGSERPIQLKDLMVLAKIGAAGERSAVCERLASGKARSAAEARRQQRGTAAPALSRTDRSYLALCDAWSRASKPARRRFVRDCREELERAGLDLAKVDAGTGSDTGSGTGTTAQGAGSRKSAPRTPRLRAVK
ncbi:MAG: ParB N-terminal domain-containing protein [Rhodobacter sp.]|nr:ParB N-terminal domain-containing protein [Rhodobacter sp.]